MINSEFEWEKIICDEDKINKLQKKCVEYQKENVILKKKFDNDNILILNLINEKNKLDCEYEKKKKLVEKINAKNFKLILYGKKCIEFKTYKNKNTLDDLLDDLSKMCLIKFNIKNKMCINSKYFNTFIEKYGKIIYNDNFLKII